MKDEKYCVLHHEHGHQPHRGAAMQHAHRRLPTLWLLLAGTGRAGAFMLSQPAALRGAGYVGCPVASRGAVRAAARPLRMTATDPLRPVDVGAAPDACLVKYYDTTLRDGAQGEGISLSCDDKLRIAARLSKFGADYIEAGWPGSNPKDAEFFERAQDELDEAAWSKVVAFGSTR